MKIVNFSGYEWVVKSGSRPKGPGNNWWSENHVWVDETGLHLKVAERHNHWKCAEVKLAKPLGYGKYRFYVDGRIDQLDKNVVLGLFLYKNDKNEIDIEFSRWGKEKSRNAQYVMRDMEVTKERFNMKLAGNYTTHVIDWNDYAVEYTSIHGHYSRPPKQNLIWEGYFSEQYDMGGELIRGIPEGDLKVHINLWLHNGQPPSNGKSHEIIIKRFEYDPASKGRPAVHKNIIDAAFGD
ncbi:MAG: hypothetical protein AB1757_06890 [Acidobacteriota bacterium]